MRKLFCALVSFVCLMSVSPMSAYALEVGPHVTDATETVLELSGSSDNTVSGAIQLSYEVVDTGDTGPAYRRVKLGPNDKSFAEIQTGDPMSYLLPLSLATAGTLFVVIGAVLQDRYCERKYR